MYIDLVGMKYLDGYRLELKFADGKKGSVDFAAYLKKGGVYRRFRDAEYFKKAYVNKELGVLCWPDGVDVAPETLYSEATGKVLAHVDDPGKTRKEKAQTSKSGIILKAPRITPLITEKGICECFERLFCRRPSPI